MWSWTCEDVPDAQSDVKGPEDGWRATTHPELVSSFAASPRKRRLPRCLSDMDLIVQVKRLAVLAPPELVVLDEGMRPG